MGRKKTQAYSRIAAPDEALYDERGRQPKDRIKSRRDFSTRHPDSDAETSSDFVEEVHSPGAAPNKELDDEHPPSSEDVDTMNDMEVFSWIMRLIGSDGRCERNHLKRSFLKKYLENLKKNPSSQSLPLSVDVDSLPYNEVVVRVLSQIGDFGSCKDEKSQRELLTAYLNNRKRKTELEVVLQPKGSSLDQLQYEEVSEIMKYFGIKSTGFELTDKTLLNQKLLAGDSMVTHEQKVQDTLKLTIRKYRKVKEKVRESYVEIKDIVETNLFSKERDGPLQEMFPNYMDNLKAGLETLQTDATDLFEIVVIGETSSGKSTFLNALLGENILPSHLLHTTSCLCRLHNSPKRMVSYQTKEGITTNAELCGSPSDVNKKLEAIVGKEIFDGKNLNVVDLYWPIPVLLENVILVDTPGIGETYKLTEEVVQRVPKAAGYILILNASNAGGVQEDRILKLLIEIRKVNEEKRPLSHLLFVYNKWDLVEVGMREAVMKDTMSKLEDFCGEIKPWQVITFSATQELKLRQLKANPTKDFDALLEGFEFLMVESIERRIGISHQWIFWFLAGLQNFVDAMATASLLSVEDLNPRVRRARAILREANKKLKPEIKMMEKQIASTAKDMSKTLQTHLKSKEVREELTDWANNDPDYKGSPLRGRVLASAKLRQFTSKWSKTGPLSERTKDIKEKLHEMQAYMESTFQTIHELGIGFRRADDAKYKSFTESKEDTGSNLSRIAQMVKTFITGFVHYLGSVTDVGDLIFLRDDLTKKQYIDTLKKNALDTIDTFASDTKISKFISEEFTDPLNTLVRDFRSFFKRNTKSMCYVLDDIERDNTYCSYVFRQLQDDLRAPSLKIRRISIEYFSPVSVSCETISFQKEPFSRTDIANVHVVNTSKRPRPVTLRVIHPHLAPVHIREFSKMRHMEHTNFIRYEGVVFSMLTAEQEEACGYRAETFNLLIEECTSDLEAYIFSNPQFQGRVGSASAEKFFMKMASGIIAGLNFVHEKGLVHGYLELSSILLTSDMTPKLCDINIPPDLSGTRVERCIFHTAPEVTRGKCRPEADIYSFGILLWELWYGKHVGREDDRLSNSLKFEVGSLKKAVKSIIRQCSNRDPRRRPSAKECIELF